MRYKDFLIILLLLAVASWTWAEPSRKPEPAVIQPTLSQDTDTRQASPLQDWTVPNLDLQGAEERISGSGRPIVPLSDFDRIRHPLLEPLEVGSAAPLEVLVVPGRDFDSTHFEIWVAKDKREEVAPLQTVAFELFIESEPRRLGVSSAVPTGSHSWTFTGADVVPIGGGTPYAGWNRELKTPALVSFRTHLLLAESNRFSRGANTTLLRSAPFVLKLESDSDSLR